jgi:hypothetical protein
MPLAIHLKKLTSRQNDLGSYRAPPLSANTEQVKILSHLFISVYMIADHCDART